MNHIEEVFQLRRRKLLWISKAYAMIN